MTDNLPSFPSPEGVSFYRLTNDEWLDAVQNLRPAERVVLYYLRTLDPFGDRVLDIKVRELARILDYDAETVSRALKTLDSSGYIELDLINVRVRVISSRKSVALRQHCCAETTLLSGDNDRCAETTPMISTQHFNTSSQMKPLQGKGFRNGNVPIKEQTLLENKQTGSPTTHPVVEIDREEFGTSPTSAGLEQLSALIDEAGVRPNKTIQKTLVELLNHQDPAAARQVVENALSALQEQQKAGKVRNPGGFLRAALQRGFTANRAKREARTKRHQKREPPNLVQVSAAIDQALAHGDRAFALAKLQNLWAEGWQAEVQELVGFFRPDWKFQVTQEGVSDEDAAMSGL